VKKHQGLFFRMTGMELRSQAAAAKTADETARKAKVI